MLAAGAARAEPKRYEIRPTEGSRLELRVYKTGFMRGKVHLFQFPQYSGTLVYDPQKPEASEVRLSISAAAIQLMDTWLSAKDMKSVLEYAQKDMLAAGKFPEIAFASSQVRAAGAGFEVSGTLTIRGLGKPALINVTLNPGAPAELAVQGTAKVRLTHYGLKPPTAALGTIGTKDEMDFSVVLLVR